METDLVIKGIRVDPRLIVERAREPCQLEQCRGRCCRLGVWVGMDQQAEIMAHRELVRRFLPKDQRDEAQWWGDTWVDEEALAEGKPYDFPFSAAVATNVVEENGRRACVFLAGDGRCLLQAASIAAGYHPWRLKPFYCAISPIYLENGTLTLADESAELLGDVRCQRDDGPTRPYYQVFHREIRHVLGDDGYAELERAASEWSA